MARPNGGKPAASTKLAPVPIYLRLIAIGEQRPSGARDGPACRLHLRVGGSPARHPLPCDLMTGLLEHVEGRFQILGLHQHVIGIVRRDREDAQASRGERIGDGSQDADRSEERRVGKECRL